MAFYYWCSLMYLYLVFNPVNRNSDLKIVTFYCLIFYKHFFFDRTSNAYVKSCAISYSIKISVLSDEMSCSLLDKYDFFWSLLPFLQGLPCVRNIGTCRREYTASCERIFIVTAVRTWNLMHYGRSFTPWSWVIFINPNFKFYTYVVIQPL